MNKSVPHKSEMILLCQILRSFFKSVRENREGIGDLLQKYKELRKEYVKLLRDDVIMGLVQTKGEGAIGGNLSRERLATLLEKLIVSFRADQQKSYQVLEQGLCKEILEKVSEEILEESLKDLSDLKQEMKRIIEERDHLSQEREKLGVSLSQLNQQCETLKHEKESLQSKVAMLTRELNEMKGIKVAAEDYQEDLQLAVDDYQNIIKEIRQELEGKKAYDLWRLKVFYNRVASLTNSTWSYTGVPKPDPWEPKSRQAKKFLESL